MDNIFLLKEINKQAKQLSEGKCGEGSCGGKRSENEEVSTLNILSTDEMDNLVSFAHEDLADIGMQLDFDAVSDKIGEYVENIPGLEDYDTQQKAIRDVLDLYRQRYMAT